MCLLMSTTFPPKCCAAKEGTLADALRDELGAPSKLSSNHCEFERRLTQEKATLLRLPQAARETWNLSSIRTEQHSIAQACGAVALRRGTRLSGNRAISLSWNS